MATTMYECGYRDGHHLHPRDAHATPDPRYENGYRDGWADAGGTPPQPCAEEDRGGASRSGLMRGRLTDPH